MLIALHVSATLLATDRTTFPTSTENRVTEVAPRDDLMLDEPCHSTTPSLLLVITDVAHVPATSLDIAMREVQAIWATAGLHLVRHDPSIVLTPALMRRQVPIVIRRALTSTTLRIGRVNMPSAESLGRVGLDSEGHPVGRVEVAFEAVTSFVYESTYLGKRVSALPVHVQEYLVGHALGRVLAHEIGHWLFGREHALDGLMKGNLTSMELIYPPVPALPVTWTTPGPGYLLAKSSQCEGETRTSTARPAAPLLRARALPTDRF